MVALRPASRRFAVLVALVTGMVGLHAQAAFAVAPANDDIANATTLTTTPVTGSNVEATSDSPSDVCKAEDNGCNVGGMSVWYRIPNPGKGWFTVNGDSANTNFDAQLAVYHGAAGSVTDTSGIAFDFTSWQRFGTAVTTDPVGVETIPGDDYFVVIDGYSDGMTVPSGNFRFDWSFTPAPINDNFADATTLATTSASDSASTTGATLENLEPNITGTEPDSSFFFNIGAHSVWYKWVAPASGQATIDTHTSSFDTVLAVYTGSTMATLAQVPNATSDDTSSIDLTSEVTFPATATETYRIQIDGIDDGVGGAAFGPYTVHLNEVVAPPPDLTPPTISSFTPAEGSSVRGTAVAVTGNATDAGSGVGSMSFTIDAGSIIAPTVDSGEPFGFSFNSTLLTDGSHTINVTATDKSNNTTNTQTHHFKVDNTAPLQPHFTTTLAPFTAATTATVNFTDTDATSGINTYQVQVEKANFNATGFGAWAIAPGATALVAGTYRLTGLAAGWDYCLRVIAKDKAGNVSVASKPACTSRLIDDKSAVHSAGWTQGASSTYYGGSASTAKSANRTLTLAGFRGVRLGIMAVQCSTCGAIRIYVGTTLIKAVSLVSAVKKKTIILLPVFSSRAGTIKILTTSTKPVTIDAIGASRT